MTAPLGPASRDPRYQSPDGSPIHDRLDHDVCCMLPGGCAWGCRQPGGCQDLYPSPEQQAAVRGYGPRLGAGAGRPAVSTPQPPVAGSADYWDRIAQWARQMASNGMPRDQIIAGLTATGFPDPAPLVEAALNGRGRSRPYPRIVVNQDQGVLIGETIAALAEINWPPLLFRRGGVMARVGSDDDGRRVILPMDRAAIRAELAILIEWVKAGKGECSPAGVPPVVADLLLTHADKLCEELPVLDQVVTAPVFAPDGTLVTEPGYNPAARVWYQPVGGMKMPPVSGRPSRTEVNSAAKLLVAEYLGDFPFDGEASRQHALGALVLPFARLMIDGPVPLQCADATTPGSGKGLLQRAQMYPALGSMLPALPGVLDDEEELRKKITTVLMRGQQVIRWDNVTSRVDSPSLSSVLTEPVWEDRLLGASQDVQIPVRSIFLIRHSRATPPSGIGHWHPRSRHAARLGRHPASVPPQRRDRGLMRL